MVLDTEIVTIGDTSALKLDVVLKDASPVLIAVALGVAKDE